MNKPVKIAFVAGLLSLLSFSARADIVIEGKAVQAGQEVGNS